jgi:hypothetical protein
MYWINAFIDMLEETSYAILSFYLLGRRESLHLIHWYLDLGLSSI